MALLQQCCEGIVIVATQMVHTPQMQLLVSFSLDSDCGVLNRTESCMNEARVESYDYYVVYRVAECSYRLKLI